MTALLLTSVRKSICTAIVAFVSILIGIVGNDLRAQSPSGWTWAVNSADPGNEVIYDMAVDTTDGMIYVVGELGNGVNYSGLNANKGGTDGFIAKYDPSGNIKWAFIVGGPNDDACYGICIGPDGNLYVTGSFEQTANFNTSNAVLQPSLASLGNTDIFVASYQTDGNLRWVRSDGGNSDDEGVDIAANNTGVFVTGNFTHSATIAGQTTVAALNNSKLNTFIAHYDFSGNGSWLVNGGSSENDAVRCIAVDESSVYIIGTTPEIEMDWFNASGILVNTTSATSGENIFITSFSSNGVFNWGQVIDNPGSNVINGEAIAIGCSGLYITGSTQNNSIFPGGYIVFTPTDPFDYLYLAKLDPTSGNTIWVKTATGGSDEHQVGKSLHVDHEGSVYLVGTFKGFFDLGGLILTGTSEKDAFILKLSESGMFMWTLKGIGNEDDIPNAVNSDREGHVYMAGQFDLDFDLQPNYLSTGQFNNLFLTRIDDPSTRTTLKDPSRWNHRSPVCSSTLPIDLNNWLSAWGIGHADAIVGATPVLNSTNALNAVDDIGAEILNNNDSLKLDLTDTISAGDPYAIVWEKQQLASGEAMMMVYESIDGIQWTLNPDQPTTSITEFTDEIIIAATDTRFIKLIRKNDPGSAQFNIDAIYYSLGAMTGGTWSGPGVSGSMFNPNGLSGQISITYSIATNSCIQDQTTRSILINEPPVGGILSGPSLVCPSTNSGTLSLSGHSGTIVWWESSTDLFATGDTTVTDQSTFSFSNLSDTTWYRALISSEGCGEIYSSTFMVAVGDIIAPSGISAIPLDPFNVASNSCTFPAPNATGWVTATDNCTTALTYSQSPVLGTALSLGSNTITVTATDASGNSTDWNLSISVVDTISPIITICASDQTINANLTTCSANMVDFTGLITATDNCNVQSITQDIAPGTIFSGTAVLTFTVTDDIGNTSTCTINVSVQDNEDPVITVCPIDQLISTNIGNCDGSMVDYTGFVSATDNCNVQSIVQDIAPGSIISGTVVLTFTVSDNAGNTATCSINVSLEDNEDPAITTCAIDQLISANVGTCQASMADFTGLVSATDNCSNVTVTQNITEGTTITGSTLLTFTVVDDEGNSTQCSINVDVEDNEDPQVTCPGDQTFTADAGDCQAIVVFAIPVATDNCSAVSTTLLSGIGTGIFPVGTTTQQYRSEDASGNFVTCSFDVIVEDNEDPQLICPVDISTNVNNGDTDIAVAYALPTATDNCGIQNIWLSSGLASGALFPIGMTTVEYTADDINGNQTTCSFTVTVNDSDFPEITCPSNISQNVDAGVCSAVVVYTPPVGTDTQGPTTTVQSDATGLTNGSAFPVGTTILEYTVTDAPNNATTCAFSIEVIDNILPVIICRNDTILSTDAGTCSKILNYDLPVWSDNCPGGTITRTQGSVSGDAFSIGVTVVEHRIQDNAGNIAVCSFQVTVFDNEAPIATCPSDINIGSDVGICGAIVNYMLPTGNNLCGIDVIQLISGLASGSQFPVGSTEVKYKVSDIAGNSDTCSFFVHVSDDIFPIITYCPNYFTVPSDPGNCTAEVHFARPQFNDECGAVMTLVSGIDSAGTFPIGTTVVSYKIHDAAGNNVFCTFNITVEDNESPSIVCPVNDTLAADVNCEAALPDYTGSFQSLTDNCSGSGSVQQSPIAGTMVQGSTLVTLQVLDAASNLGQCSFTVFVEDQTPPIILCPGDQQLSGDQNCQATLPDYSSSASITDNCNTTVTISQNPPIGFIFSGTQSVELIAKYANGLADTCTFNVEVVDDTPPLLTCLPASQFYADASCLFSIPAVNPSIVDCDSNPIITQIPAVGTSVGPGVHVVNVTVTDANSNVSTCQTTITVLDTVSPVISTCPGPQVLIADDQCQAVLLDYTGSTFFSATECSQAILPVQTPSPGSTFTDSTLVFLTVTDLSGNNATCSFMVTLNDTIAPLFVCTSDTSVFVSANCDAVVPNMIAALSQVEDNCDPNIQFVQTPASGTIVTGNTTITIVGNDASGNTRSRTTMMTLADSIAPTASCSDITVNAALGASDAVVNYPTPSGVDNCGPINVVQTDLTGLSSGSNFPLGATQLEYTFSDTSGNSSICTFLVNVMDMEDPTINCPNDTIVPADSLYCGNYVSWPIPVGLDNDIGATTIQTIGPAPGSFFGVGTTTIEYTVTDISNNSTSCAFTVTVLDQTIPTIACPNDTTVYAGLNCETQVNFALPSTFDNCGLQSLQPISPLGPGSLFPVGQTTVEIEAIDVHNNSSTCSMVVTVLDTITPTITCNSDTILYLIAGECGVPYTYQAPVVSDVCPGVSDSLLSGLASGSIFPVGNTVVQFEAYDVSNNSSTCSFTVSVLDTANVYLSYSNSTICSSNGDLSPAMYPAGGSFSVAPIGSSIDPVTGIITPSASAAGQYQISYTVNGPCPLVATFDLTINDAPSFVNAGPDSTICTDTYDMLANTPSSGSGTWSTLNGNATFSDLNDPSASLTSISLGPNTFVWSISNGTCLSISDTLILTVLQGSDASWNAPTDVCETNGVINLDALATEPGGIWTGLGVNGNEFNPSGLSGAIEITHTNGDIPCQEFESHSINVWADVDPTWAAFGPICNSEDPIGLDLHISGTTGGTWSGQGVNGNLFDPNGLLGFIQITYTVGGLGCEEQLSNNIEVLPGVEAKAGEDDEVCSDQYQLNANIISATGTWSGPLGVSFFPEPSSPNATVSVSTYGSHEFIWTVTNATCTASDTVLITFFELLDSATVHAGADRIVDEGVAIQLEAEPPNSGTGTWTVIEGSGEFEDMNDANSIVTELSLGENIFLWTVLNGSCGSYSDEVIYTMNGFFIPHGFSPNNDGVNDFFEITGISRYPDNDFQVYDRWGKEVYRSKGYNNEWNGDGKNGKPLADDTYFYILNLNGISAYNGYIIIKR